MAGPSSDGPCRRADENRGRRFGRRPRPRGAGWTPGRDAAQTLASGRSMIILLVLPDWPVGHTLQRSLEESTQLLDDAGYSLVAHVRHEGGRARPLWESLNPDAVIGWTPITAGERASMRAVGITRILPTDQEERTFLASPTLTAGARAQVEHLHALGHRRLAFAASADPRVALISKGRAAAAQETAARLGLAPLDVRPVDPRDGGALEAVRDWHRSGVTGVVAHQDDIALALMTAALRSGLPVPDDLSVIGHDDSPFAELLFPSMSSVRLDYADLSRYFADLVLRLAEDRPLPEAAPDFQATVVPRESTGAPRQVRAPGR